MAYPRSLCPLKRASGGSVATVQGKRAQAGAVAGGTSCHTLLMAPSAGYDIRRYTTTNKRDRTACGHILPLCRLLYVAPVPSREATPALPPLTAPHAPAATSAGSGRL